MTNEELKAKCNETFERMRTQYQPSMNMGDLQSVAKFIEMLTEEKPKTIYEENGYANRREYIKSLSEEYAVPYHIVVTLASTLGPNEDFDGLVTSLQDIEGTFDEDAFDEGV